MIESLCAPLEVKFADAAAGEFDGLASPFGNTDSHGDVVMPGAFAQTLAEHKARGTMPAMYVQHGAARGADPLPVGIWTDLQETPEGLRVKGRISALDTDFGKRVRALVSDGALRGLSMGFRVAPGGAIYGKRPGEPKRTLKAVHLAEVSLVEAGSNARARVENIKAAAYLADEVEEFKSRLAAGEVPTLREVERLLRDAMGLSRAQAEAFAGLGFKGLARESGAEAKQAAANAARDLRTALDGFSLPRFS